MHTHTYLMTVCLKLWSCLRSHNKLGLLMLTIQDPDVHLQQILPVSQWTIDWLNKVQVDSSGLWVALALWVMTPPLLSIIFYFEAFLHTHYTTASISGWEERSNKLYMCVHVHSCNSMCDFMLVLLLFCWSLMRPLGSCSEQKLIQLCQLPT